MVVSTTAREAAPGGERSGNRSAWLEALLVAGLFLGLTVVATFRGVLYWSSHFIGREDSAQLGWTLWWVGRSARAGDLAPSFTPLLYFPSGVSLAYHPTMPLNGWLGAALGAAGLSLPAVFNTLVFVAMVASALGVYAVVRRLGGSPGAGLLAGVAFTFAPYRMSRISIGALELFSTEFLPWFVLALLRLRETRQWRYAGAAALALALTAYCSLNLAFNAALLAACVYLPGAGEWRHWRALAVRGLAGLGLAGLLMLPLLWPMVRDRAAFAGQQDWTVSAIENSADLLGYFVPDTSPYYTVFAGNAAEKQVFLGYKVLAASALILTLAPPAVYRRWLLTAALFGLLSLGPVLHLGGRALWTTMPYGLLLEVPFIGLGRVPSRLALCLLLALALLVGLGWRALEQRWPRLRWAAGLLALLAFVEFNRSPVGLDERLAEIPDYYQRLASEPATGAILDLPADFYGAQGPAGTYMLYQTVHQHPIMGGYISRTPASVLEPLQNPFIYQLRARMYTDTVPYIFDVPALRRGLAELPAGLEWIILHKDQLAPDDARAARAALAAVLATPEFEDERLVVWKMAQPLVPTSRAAPPGHQSQ